MGLRIKLVWLCMMGGMLGISMHPPEDTRLVPKDLDPCKLYGAIYVEQTAAFADYRVFVQDIEAFADLVVYKESGDLYADQTGLWYLTDTKSFADFSIYIEDVEAFAQFTIAYTPFRSAAGCNPR
ncbi:MAG: DUF6150 family protein [Bacteroidota bacterium]